MGKNVSCSKLLRKQLKARQQAVQTTWSWASDRLPFQSWLYQLWPETRQLTPLSFPYPHLQNKEHSLRQGTRSLINNLFKKGNGKWCICYRHHHHHLKASTLIRWSTPPGISALISSFLSGSSGCTILFCCDSSINITYPGLVIGQVANKNSEMGGPQTR